jgi:DNA-binding Lrp family transcriptional regulator
MDSYDRRILSVLQRDARISNQQLAKEVGLSPSPCWRRVRRLEESGVIEQYVARLSRRELGFPVLAYVQISLEDHHPDTIREFDDMIRRCDEVQECCSMSGQYDYLIKVVARNMEGYEDFLSGKLLRLSGVQTANTSFVLKQKKSTSALPL